MNVRMPTGSRLHRLPSPACTDLSALTASLSSFAIRSATVVELLETNFIIGEGKKQELECGTLYTLSVRLHPIGFRKVSRNAVVFLYADILTCICKMAIILPVDDEDDDSDPYTPPSPDSPPSLRELVPC
jgi:hypothetical protein